MVRRNDKETTVRRLTVPMMLIALLMSACQIRTDIAIEINADESGTIAFELGFDEELRQLAESEGGEFSLDGFDGLSEDVPAGWTVGDFDDGEFAGTRISTRFSSLDDLRTQLAALDSGSGDDPESGALQFFPDWRRKIWPARHHWAHRIADYRNGLPAIVPRSIKRAVSV